MVDAPTSTTGPQEFEIYLVSINDTNTHPVIFPTPARLRRENHWPSSCWTIYIDCSPQELWPFTNLVYSWHANDRIHQLFNSTRGIITWKHWHLSVALDSTPPQLVDNVTRCLPYLCKPTHHIGETSV